MAVSIFGGLGGRGERVHLEHSHCDRAHPRPKPTCCFAARGTRDEGRRKVARAWPECSGAFARGDRGKVARGDLAKGTELAVFAALAVGGRHMAASEDQFVSDGIAASRHSGAAGSRVDGTLAAKLLSGRSLIRLGSRRQSAVYWVWRFYLGLRNVRGPCEFETDVELVATLGRLLAVSGVCCSGCVCLRRRTGSCLLATAS